MLCDRAKASILSCAGRLTMSVCLQGLNITNWLLGLAGNCMWRHWLGQSAATWLV